MPEERTDSDDQASDQEREREREFRRGQGESRRRHAVTFGLGVAALAGVISVTGSVAAPPSKTTDVTTHGLTSVDPHAPINQLIAGGDTYCLLCSHPGCGPVGG